MAPVLCFGEDYDPDSVDKPDPVVFTLKINGLDKTMKASVLSLIGLKAFRFSMDATLDEIQTTYNESEEIIATYLRSQGYYAGKIDSSLSKKPNSWRAEYNINPGPPVLVNRVIIEVIGPGEFYPPVQEFRDDFPIKIGDRFVHSSYEAAKNQLLKLATQNGYLDAKLTQHKIEVHRKQFTADIRLSMSTGKRYFFGVISIIENKIDPALIQKFIILNEGEPYSSAQILEQQNSLGDSDYYSEIYVKPRRDLAVDYKVPVEITTVLRKPSKYSVGLGYSTDLGIKGSLSWSRRRLNYKGHRLYLGAIASKIGATVGIRYRIPFRNPRHDEYVITTNITYQNPDTSESRIAQLGLARSVLRGNWREILSLDIQREIFSVGKQDDSANLLLPSVNWMWVVPRGKLNVRKGHMLSVTARGSSKALLSSASFMQTYANTKWIFPVSKKGRLLTRGYLGLTAVESIFELPASFRFFAGGDQNIRGYSFASLGPKNPEGEVIGGKHMLVASVEYDYRIFKDGSMAVFYDVGNAFNAIDSINVAHGVGLGVRWTTLIGQIRLDVANAVSEEDKPWRVHLSIGPDL